MSGSPYSDLGRPPLSAASLSARLVRAGSLWREIRVVRETGSTNADLARRGALEGTVLVAEAQSAGRGRLGRSWSAPPRSGLTFSIVLRPSVPVAVQGWLPLLTGVAVAAAVRKLTARAQGGRFEEFGGIGGGFVQARLKWPNDVLVGERKLAGILAERADGAVIVGVGLNVGLRRDELPVPTATSLAIENAAATDREPLLLAVLRQIEQWYAAWTAVNGDSDHEPAAGYPQLGGAAMAETGGGGLRGSYRALCATLGREVRVELPGKATVTGLATGIDEVGRLVVDGRPLSAGDVVHVR